MVKEVAKGVPIMEYGICPGRAFLYKIEGYEGCYCYDCAKILSHGQIKQTLKNKISQEQS